MPNLIDLSGQRFSRLTVMRRTQHEERKTFWACVCDCGNECVVRADQLKNGTSISCGCVGAMRLAEQRFRHGYVGSRTYRIWQNMTARCGRSNHPSYPVYGGAGIRVCAAWKRFEAFIADMGEAPDGYSIDRIDGRYGYELNNCRWADNATQARNKKSNLWIEYDGRKQILSDWAKELNMKTATLYGRVRSGWSVPQAFTQSVKSR